MNINNDLVSASDDKTIRIWNLQDGNDIDVITGFTDYIYGMVC